MEELIMFTMFQVKNNLTVEEVYSLHNGLDNLEKLIENNNNPLIKLYISSMRDTIDNMLELK